MQATLHDPVSTKCCVPITSSRALGECLIGNRELQKLIAMELTQVGFEVIPIEEATDRTVHLPMDHWVEVGALCLLARNDGAVCMRDKSGDLIAWKGAKDPSLCGQNMVTEADCFRIQYPWDLLQLNEEVLTLIEEQEPQGQISHLAQVDGFLHLGKGSIILPGVYIEGNVVIGDHCKIGPNAYIRGNTSIGHHSVIGNAVEVKNSVIYPHANIKHLSYVGDSIIGSHVSLGAGTIIANHRHDGTNHRSSVKGSLVDTQRNKFGAVLGDGVRTGVNTCVYPGRKIGAGRMTRPNTIVDRDMMPLDKAGEENRSGYQI
ncbi:MAG: hypothetical protein AB8F34_12960 [Akkermansiaceae bacterium]